MHFESSFCYLLSSLFAGHVYHSFSLATLLSLHGLPLQLLKDSVTVLQLNLILFYLFLQRSHLRPHLLVFLKQIVRLRLEVVELVAELPDLVVSVLVFDRLV